MNFFRIKRQEILLNLPHPKVFKELIMLKENKRAHKEVKQGAK